MIRRPPRSTQSRSSAASDVYKRQRAKRAPNLVERVDLLGEILEADHAVEHGALDPIEECPRGEDRAEGEATLRVAAVLGRPGRVVDHLSLIHISEPTRLGMISYAVFCLKKKN